jgi:peptide/nickel transport system substrate-binding protein
VLKDKAFRAALDTAIDRKTLIEKVYGNRATPATGVIPSLYAQWHWQPPAGEERTFDLAKANSMLDAAGYPKGADGIRTDKAGKKISLRLFGRSTSEFSQKDVQYISGWFRQIGVDTQVDIMSEEQLTEVIGQGEYDMFHWGWVVEPDPDFQLSVFTCGQRSYDDGGTIVAGWSDSFYCDENYDRLYEQQQTILDAAQRTQVFMQMQKQLYDDVVYSMLYYYDNLEAYRSDRFTNITRQPTDGGSIVFQYGTYTYRNITPVADPEKGPPLGLILGIAGGVVGAVALAGLVVAFTRRGRAAERE